MGHLLMLAAALEIAILTIFEFGCGKSAEPGGEEVREIVVEGTYLSEGYNYQGGIYLLYVAGDGVVEVRYHSEFEFPTHFAQVPNRGDHFRIVKTDNGQSCWYELEVLDAAPAAADVEPPPVEPVDQHGAWTVR